ncbi:MAG: ABC transporter permease [Vicinamibacteraceae bacterium]
MSTWRHTATHGVAWVDSITPGRAEMAAASPIWPMQITAPGAAQPESGQVQLVSGEYFRVLRQRPQIGRLLGPNDNRTLGQRPVAVISDGYFRRTFDRSPDVLGRTLVINGAPVTIVGVAAPGFFGTTLKNNNADVWMPVMMQADIRYAGNRASHNGDDLKPWPPQREIEWLNIFVRVPAGNVVEVAEGMTLALQRDYRLRIGYNDDTERANGTRQPGSG